MTNARVIAPANRQRRSGLGLSTRLLAAAIAIASCDQTNGQPGRASPVPVPDTPETLTVELGTGDVGFEPLADGGDVSLVFGPQGGYHVTTAVRVRGTDLTEARVNLHARYKGGSLAGLPSSETGQWLPSAGGGVEAAGLRTFITDRLASGTELTLRADVVGRDGRHGASERRVIVR